MQLRDQKPGIFYPGHWGCFGGALDPGETPETGLRRELREELGVDVGACAYFTEFSFDFSPLGGRPVLRRFYEARVEASILPRIVLGEGAAMRAFDGRQLLARERVTPYDALAIWMHRARRASGACDVRLPRIDAILRGGKCLARYRRFFARSPRSQRLCSTFGAFDFSMRNSSSARPMGSSNTSDLAPSREERHAESAISRFACDRRERTGENSLRGSSGFTCTAACCLDRRSTNSSRRSRLGLAGNTRSAAIRAPMR